MNSKPSIPLCVLLMAVLLLNSCQSPNVLKHVISWDLGWVFQNDGNEANYTFNGKPVGKGDVAFKNIIKILSKLPVGSMVILDYKHVIPDNGVELSYIYPFDPLAGKLEEVIRDRRLKIVDSYLGKEFRNPILESEN